MEILKKVPNIDFLRYTRAALIFSGLLTLGSVACLFARGLNFGLDFTGGTVIELEYETAVDLDRVRGVLKDSEFSSAVSQYYGSAEEVLIRLAPHKDLNSAEISEQIVALLSAGEQKPQVRRVEFVGAQVGEELAEDGGLAMLYSLMAILVYVALRFQMRFALGAIVALAHDAIITVGFFSLTQLDFDLTVLAAILALIGYSLNDTIVVFDRVRENFRRMRAANPMEVFNVAINQTLSRTINTGVTTLLVLLSLLIWGGEALHSFSLALIVGILFGTYSSVYVASALAVLLGVSKKDFAQVEKEGADRPALR